MRELKEQQLKRCFLYHMLLSTPNKLFNSVCEKHHRCKPETRKTNLIKVKNVQRGYAAEGAGWQQH